MKEMTLNDVQTVSLDIMKNLNDFCEEHSIKYSLGYGSLIGAIRHNGFIPWDDDMDVVMMRDDFNRFCEIYEDNVNFKLFSYNRGNTYSAVARLCEMKKTFVKTGLPLFTEETGVWIDIFPLDSVDNDKRIFDIRKQEIKTIHEKVIKCRDEMRKWSWNSCINILQLKIFCKWLLHVSKARRDINKLVKIQNDLCETFANDDNHNMSMLAFPIYIDRDFCPKDVFKEVDNHIFEQTSFKIMKGYDKWLTIIYGDYMTPPPVEKQTRGHSYHSYFWR